MRRDRLDPVRRYRDARAEFDPFRLLGRERHADVDVAVDHLRVVKPCVREAVVLGDAEVLPRVRTGWVCDSEFHGRRLPRLRFHPRYRPQLSREADRSALVLHQCRPVSVILTEARNASAGKDLGQLRASEAGTGSEIAKRSLPIAARSTASHRRRERWRESATAYPSP